MPQKLNFLELDLNFTVFLVNFSIEFLVYILQLLDLHLVRSLLLLQLAQFFDE